MYSKIFDYAITKGIESLELYIVESESIEISLFHGELDNYLISKVKSISARGIFNGKMGYASSEKYDASTAKSLVDSIISNAKIVTSEDKSIIYPGDKQYTEVNVYNEQLKNVPMSAKIALLKEIEKKALAFDPAIVEVATNTYNETSQTTSIINDKGLNLFRKNNMFTYYVDVVAKEENGNRDGDCFVFNNDFNKIVPDQVVKTACDNAISMIGAKPIKSGPQKVVLDAKMMAAMLGVFLGNTFASTVQDGMSKLADKLGQSIGNKLITIIEDPLLASSITSTGFDDEGVATKKKTIVDKGVLKMFLYNLKRASKGNTVTTGNGYRSGNMVAIDVRNAYLVCGDQSKKQLMEQVGNGLYITELAGMHAGIDSVSGDFSLQARGYVIKNGKKDLPVSLITVSGNVYKILNTIEALGNDADFAFNPDIKAPSVIISELMVAGL